VSKWPRLSAVELLERGTGFLDSRHFQELGYSERATESIRRNTRVVRFPDFGKDLVPVEDYLAYVAGHTYCDRCGDRVRPSRNRARIGERP
jgi:hypothetical protein